jgi:hypothetical protein
VGVAIGAGIGTVLGWLTGSLYTRLCECAGPPVAGWVMLGAIQFGAWGALFGSQGVEWGPAP